MKESIDLGQGTVCVVRKSKRARRLRITLGRDGNVVLTLPTFVSYAYGRVFLESKKEWIREKKAAQALRPQALLLQGSAAEYQASHGAARILIEERLAYFQKFYGVSWKRVSIRNQKTRWGSCARNGNLSFNYRLLLLPAHLCDYVIVHELCHLIEFNHSPKFWALINQVLPDSSSLRHELKLL